MSAEAFYQYVFTENRYRPSDLKDLSNNVYYDFSYIHAKDGHQIFIGMCYIRYCPCIQSFAIDWNCAGFACMQCKY